jgi:phage recombination protein Bet
MEQKKAETSLAVKDVQTTGKEVMQKDALGQLAHRLGVGRKMLESTLTKTAFQACKTPEQFVAAVIVANTYGLNPLLKEMTAFPASTGGVTPVVMIDGWISLVQRQPDYDGVELVENRGKEKNISGTDVDSITAKFYIKNKSHAVVVTEYMIECYDGTKGPWKRWPIRMLRHKAYIQGARVAFGFSGIYDEDEKDRIEQGQQVIDVGTAPIVGLKSLEKPAQEPVKEAPIEGAFSETELEHEKEGSNTPEKSNPDGILTVENERSQGEQGKGALEPAFVPSTSEKTDISIIKTEINTMLEIIYPGESTTQSTYLEALSSFISAGKTVKGVKSTEDPKFSEAWARGTHRKIKDAFLKNEADRNKRWVE